jgi:hypothetical protein
MFKSLLVAVSATLVAISSTAAQVQILDVPLSQKHSITVQKAYDVTRGDADAFGVSVVRIFKVPRNTNAVAAIQAVADRMSEEKNSEGDSLILKLAVTKELLKKEAYKGVVALEGIMFEDVATLLDDADQEDLGQDVRELAEYLKSLTGKKSVTLSVDEAPAPNVDGGYTISYNPQTGVVVFTMSDIGA